MKLRSFRRTLTIPLRAKAAWAPVPWVSILTAAADTTKTAIGECENTFIKLIADRQVVCNMHLAATNVHTCPAAIGTKPSRSMRLRPRIPRPKRHQRVEGSRMPQVTARTARHSLGAGPVQTHIRLGDLESSLAGKPFVVLVKYVSYVAQMTSPLLT